jgi:PAS domain S-box-containing protein
MRRSPEKLGTIGLGSGLLVLIVSASVASGIIAGLGGTSVSNATARSLLLIVAGGGTVGIVLIALGAYLLIRPLFVQPPADSTSAAATSPSQPAPALTPAAPARPSPAASATPSAAPALAHNGAATPALPAQATSPTSATTALVAPSGPNGAPGSVSSAHLAAIITSVPGGIVAVDAAQRIIVFNRAAERIFGVSQADMLGADPRRLIPHWLRHVEVARADRAAEPVTSRQESGMHEPLTGRRASGEEFPIEVAVSRAVVDGDEIFTAVIRDATSRVRTQEELRKANQSLTQALEDSQKAQELILRQERLRALGQLASGIAHDFNNSLSMIIGFTELLLTTPSLIDEPDTLRSNLHLIHSAAQDAANVVSRLREFSRPSAESDALPPAQVNDLIAQAISMTQPRWRNQAQASGRTIRVVTELHQVPHVAGRDGELREMLTNLVINAVDAMPAGGTLTLRSKQVGERVAVEISDTGTGMPPEVKAQIFDPFYTTKGEQGTGLGLAMVKGIVARHNGEIEVDSEPGQGTTFRIYLPISEDMAALAGAPAPALPEPRRAHDLRVLLAEDEPSLRLILASYLKIDGHSVEVAANGREALAKFQPNGFDLVVTDRAMPEMGGDQLAAQIKQVDPETPIIMLTGLGELMNEVGELPPGVDLVIPKPVTLAALRRAAVTVVSSQGV